MGVSKAVLASHKAQTEKVFIESMNDYVNVRGLTVGGRARYRQKLIRLNAKGEVEMRDDIGGAELVLLHECIVDDDGNRLFAADEIEAVQGLSPEIADAVMPVARRLSGLDVDAEDDAEKN